MSTCTFTLRKPPPWENRIPSMATQPVHIFVTGGVVSSLGKGLTAASLGMLLTRRGLRVAMQKLDPYLNVDPGTMSPAQHGEVFVTDDGAETDLDVGHYERFLEHPLSGAANLTTGRVYQEVLRKERAGEYLGTTVQVVPHVTDELLAGIHRAAEGVDVLISEVGGTVGDIESLPFLEAIRQLRHRLGRSRTMLIHCSLLPTLTNGEVKTKPTQHSVATLRGYGLTPDALILRAEHPISQDICSKIALTCDVDQEAVIPCPDSASIYSIPSVLHVGGLDTFTVRRLNLPFRDVSWEGWCEFTEASQTLSMPGAPEITVGLVGKYVDAPDAYLSVLEATRHAATRLGVKANLHYISAEAPFIEDAVRACDAVILPGGFGARGFEGKVAALQVARVNEIPALGICLGMQAMAVEAARAVGLEAGSTEFGTWSAPVVATLEEQQAHLAEGNLGGTMRLGSYPAILTPGSRAAQAYGTTAVSERHRHRYEVNQKILETSVPPKLLTISGTSPDGTLVEFLESPEHPFYVGTQAHPEFKSSPSKPHPLFLGLLRAALPQDSSPGA